MSIKLKFEGFEELIKQIEKAGGSIDNSVEQCMKKSADIMQEELKAQMQKAGVDNGLINAMPPPELERDANYYSARVGYKKGAYDPKNLSDGYKVVFLNYGTPNRKKHGIINPNDTKKRGFILKAKRKATPKIKKIQEETLNEILRNLEQ